MPPHLTPVSKGQVLSIREVLTPGPYSYNSQLTVSLLRALCLLCGMATMHWVGRTHVLQWRQQAETPRYHQLYLGLGCINVFFTPIERMKQYRLCPSRNIYRADVCNSIDTLQHA